MPAQVLQQRQRDTVRMLRDSATYNVGVDDGLNRAWQLDPVPLLISSSGRSYRSGLIS
ncbi:MAG: hypothetical protein R3F42_13610 [Pseudomonadota bacterium]